MLLTFFSFVTSCKDEGKKEEENTLKENPKIVVVSDLHYFDLSLLINKGAAFEEYITSDRKLIEESSSITASLMNSIIDENPDIVLVCGDLTKDGERKSHEGLIAQFANLKAKGIQVIVTPGNHDINNPHAFSFDGDAKTPCENVTPELFKSLYNDYGFSNAIAKGPDLCYVVEPAKDMWIISIDACEYKDNIALNTPVTGGSIDSEKLAWILAQIKSGTEQGKTVMGMMHHGVVEHFTGQEMLFSEYVVDDGQISRNLLLMQV